jgi:hypothetical protein
VNAPPSSGPITDAIPQHAPMIPYVRESKSAAKPVPVTCAQLHTWYFPLSRSVTISPITIITCSSKMNINLLLFLNYWLSPIKLTAAMMPPPPMPWMALREKCQSH